MDRIVELFKFLVLAFLVGSYTLLALLMYGGVLADLVRHNEAAKPTEGSETEKDISADYHPWARIDSVSVKRELAINHSLEVGQKYSSKYPSGAVVKQAGEGEH